MVYIRGSAIMFAMLVLVTTAAAASGATPNEDGSCLLQGSVAMKAGGDSNMQVKGMSMEAITARDKARTRLVVESHLGKFAYTYYKSFDSSKSLKDNAREAFENFLEATGLKEELDDEEEE